MQNTKVQAKTKYEENRKTRANKKKEKNYSVWLRLILPKCIGSVNCPRADRVTQAHFWFLQMPKETRFLIESCLSRRISTKANV